MKRKKRIYILGDVLGILMAVIVFIVPFAFMLVNALKERREANLLNISHRIYTGKTFWKYSVRIITRL